MPPENREAADAGLRYRVVVNDEEQYSIWPEERPSPPGWSDEGMRGSKDECLDHIETVWTDMRPLSVRRRMSEP
jgi:MbtH protein